MNRKITIKDIAEKVGVSRGTVDRVLNKRGGVAEITRKKVEKIIRELNYQPNQIARSLVLQKNYNIKVIIPSEPVGFWSKVLDGINNAAEELGDFGFKVDILSPSKRNGFKEKEILEKILEDGADGVAITPSDSVLLKKPIDKVVDSGIPVLTFNSDVVNSKRFCYVGLCNKRSGRLAGELMGKFLNGKGKVAVFVSYLTTAATEERKDGFYDIIKNNYSNIKVVATLENQDNDSISYQLTQKLLHNNPDLKGIFVTNASSAGAAHALIDAGKVGDVRLISYDISEEIIKMLKKGVIYATITQDPFTQGYQSVRRLYNYVVNKKAPEQDQVLTYPKVMFVENLNDQRVG